MILSPLPIQKFFGNDGNPLNGGLLFTYVAGTTTKLATYKDSTGGPVNTNPIVLDYRGEANVWLDPTLTYKFVLAPSTDTDPPTNPIWSVDNITAAFGIQNLTQQFLGQIIYPRTAGEIAALPVAVTPSFYIYPAQTVARYQTNTTPGVTDMSSGLQQAIDSASVSSPVVYAVNQNAISKPLLLRTTTQQDISITGNGRVTTDIVPTAASISTAPQNTNTLIFNQNTNVHLHLTHLGCFDNHSYTGTFLYCTASGGGDASAKAMFSMVLDDCWFAFSSNNSGYFKGTFINTQVTNCVFESSKTGCFIVEGAPGMADASFVNCVMNSCFDAFIYGDLDTNLKAVVSINALHCYGHLRGPVLSITKGQTIVVQDLIVEPDPGNFGTVGFAQLTDCIDVMMTDCWMISRSGVPRGAIGLSIINACTAKFQDISTDAVTGVQFAGTGALDVTFDNCDFSGCDNAVTWAGTLSGKIIFRGCRFNNSQAFGLIVLSGTQSWDLTMIDCEIMNAGLRGTATDRNFDLNTSGKVRLIRCKIGQDNGSAAAQFYVRAVGAGTLEIIDPIIVGTPPSAALFYTGAQVPTLDGVDSTTPGVPQFVPAVGGTATYTVQQGRWSLKNKTLTFNGRLTINAIGTGSANVVTGLPFTSHATINGYGSAPFFATIASTVTSLGLTVAPGGTSFTMRTLVAAAAASGTSAVFQNAADVIFGGSYPLP